MMNGFGMGVGGFGFLLMAIFWIVILVAVVWLIGNLFPRSQGGHSRASAPESAIDIVKRRYASGEISQDEFELMRHKLEQPATVRTEL